MNSERPAAVTDAGGWFLLSGRELPALNAHRVAARPGGRHLYCTAPAFRSWLELDPRQPQDWPVTRLSTASGQLLTSVMCPSSVYRAGAGRDSLLGSDPFLLAAVLGERPQDDAVGVIDPAGGTAFACVHRIGSCREHWPDGAEEPLATDPIEAAWRPTIRDGAVAGERLLVALRASVAASCAGGEAPAVLLSGGVDSASLAWSAQQLGLAPVAYSIGTVWGDEHDDAAELASHCGIPHRRIDLTVEDLLGAVRPSIRQLGHASPESVDSVLNMVAALRTGLIEQSTVLTGWGSDLLNAGLLDRPRPAYAMVGSLLAALRRTRLASEFSALAAGAAGYRLRHPYWHRAVVETALAIHPRCKYGTREKEHLRAALAPHVPASVAWRRKIALHHGTGLESGMSSYFGGAVGKARFYVEVFAELAARPLEELAAGEREDARELTAVAAGACEEAHR